MAAMPVMPPKRMVVIDDSLLASMAGNRAFLAEFPFLAKVRELTQARVNPGCGGCQGKAAPTPRNLLLGSLKATVASMGDAKKLKLKQMLNTQQVRISYLSGTRVVQHTF